MFSAVDKAIVAFIGTGVTFLVGGGWITADQGVTLATIATTLIGAAVTAFLTWWIPNKA